MNEKELVALFIRKTKDGFSVSEIARDLLLKGEDKAKIDFVLEAFAAEEASRNSTADPRLAGARKELDTLEDRYSEAQDTRRLGRKINRTNQSNVVFVIGAVVFAIAAATTILLFIW